MLETFKDDIDAVFALMLDTYALPEEIKLAVRVEAYRL